MKRIRISISGLMVLVAVLAMDLAVLPAFHHVPALTTRIGLFMAFLMAHILAVDLAIAVSGLVRRGEVALSHVTFLLFGALAILIFLGVAILAPQFFYMYISNTAGLWVPSGRQISPVLLFGMAGIRLIEALLACAALLPPLLIPALLAARATRGYRLKLVKGPEAESVPLR